MDRVDERRKRGKEEQGNSGVSLSLAESGLSAEGRQPQGLPRTKEEGGSATIQMPFSDAKSRYL